MKGVIVASSIIEEDPKEVAEISDSSIIRFEQVSSIPAELSEKNYTVEHIDITEGLADKIAENGSGVATFGLVGYIVCSDYMEHMAGDVAFSASALALSIALITQNNFLSQKIQASKVIPGFNPKDFKTQTRNLWFSSIPLVGKLFPSTYLAVSDDESIYIIESKGRCTVTRYTPKPQDPINIWDDLFELETGEKVEATKNASIF